MEKFLNENFNVDDIRDNLADIDSIVDIVRNCFLLHIFNHSVNNIFKDGADEKMFDDDGADYYCDKCNEFTSYSSSDMVETSYGALCLTDECIKNSIINLYKLS